MPLILNKLGLEICKGSECTRVTQGSEYEWIWMNNSWICLIMPKYAWIYLNIFFIYIFKFVFFKWSYWVKRKDYTSASFQKGHK